MNSGSRQSLIISVVIHGTFFLMLFLASVLHWFERKPKEEHVFELVIDSSVGEPSPAPAPMKRTDFNVPSMSEFVPVKKLPPPQPRPVAPPPVPVKPPPEKVVPVKPVPSKPKPTIPSPPPTTKAMSYEEFIRKQGAPKTRKPSPPKPRQKINVAPVDVSSIKNKLNESIKSSATGSTISTTAAHSSALNAYKTMIRSRIKSAWKKPMGLPHEQSSVTLVFDVMASGQIVNVRIIAPSAYPSFNTSTLDAFRNVGNLGPVPTGEPLRGLRLTFQLKDSG